MEDKKANTPMTQDQELTCLRQLLFETMDEEYAEDGSVVLQGKRIVLTLRETGQKMIVLISRSRE